MMRFAFFAAPAMLPAVAGVVSDSNALQPMKCDGNMMKPADICLQAAELVSGDRARQHGNFRDKFAAVAELWNGYFKARLNSPRKSEPLSPSEVADLLELLKVARRLNGERNVDNYVDAAGYAGLAGALSL